MPGQSGITGSAPPPYQYCLGGLAQRCPARQPPDEVRVGKVGPAEAEQIGAALSQFLLGEIQGVLVVADIGALEPAPQVEEIEPSGTSRSAA